MASLIDDLLDLSRVTRSALTRHNVDLSAIWKDSESAWLLGFLTVKTYYFAPCRRAHASQALRARLLQQLAEIILSARGIRQNP